MYGYISQDLVYANILDIISAAVIIPVCCVIYVSDSTAIVAVMASKVQSRLTQAFKDKTWASYRQMFLTYLAFCEFLGQDGRQPTLFNILAFLEFLAVNNLKFTTISNYVSAIKSQLLWFHLDASLLTHTKVRFMLRALERAPQGPARQK